MISDSALNYYLTTVKSNSKTVNEMAEHMKARFITYESTLQLSREWVSISLLGYMNKHKDRPLKETLDIMIKRLLEIQLALPRAYHDDTLLKNRLLNACAGVRACDFARQKVAATVMGVIHDLKPQFPQKITQ